MSSQIYRSASRAARSLLSASKASPLFFEGRAVAAASTTALRGNFSSLSSFYERAERKSASQGWIAGAMAIPAAAYMLQDQEVHAAELEQTFIAIKPDGVQRGLMAAKPLTTEAIALTEKKMDMTLDDIIKMSKKTTTKEKKAPRRPIKSQGFLNGISSQHSNRVQRFMDSRASIRQGVLAQRRSNFRGNQFPLTTNAARRAAVMPICNMRVNWNKPRLAPATAQRMAADGGIAGKDTMVVPPKQRPQTLDARFADMKENRMRVMSSQQQAFRDDNHQMAQRRRARQQQQQQVRGVRGGARPGRRPGYAVK